MADADNAELNTDVVAVLNEDETVSVAQRVTPEQLEAARLALAEAGIAVRKPSDDSNERAATYLGLAASTFPEGTLAQTRSTQPDRFLSPRLSVPANYYTRVQWANEYYEQDPIVEALVNRDIDQAIKPIEFQLPEDDAQAKIAKRVLDEWRRVLNEDIGQHGGLDEYNKATALELTLSSLIVCIANWGPIEVDGKAYRVPRVLQNLDPCLLLPYIDSFTGKRVYYYKLSYELADELRKSRRADNAWRQMIPELGRAIVKELPVELTTRANKAGIELSFLSGPWLKLPAELVYVINFRARSHQTYPVPTLVPIFPALAFKRKLQLADWAVADGMINMMLVWSFPAGTDANTAKSIVRTAASGSRVQSISIPAQVKVEIITPPTDILNSVDKFWIPISEILMHFGFPLNSRSRGAGDLDSASLDQSTNKGRMNALRDPVEALNNFWLRRIAQENKWTGFTPTGLLPRVDLDQSDAFRTFVLAVWDRGLFSDETAIALAGSTIEKEIARRKREKDEGIEDTLEIRPSFAQTTVGVPGDGRTPDSQAKPRGGTKENRPTPSSQSQTTKS